MTIRCVKCGEFFDSPFGINACPKCITELRCKAKYVPEPEIVIHWERKKKNEVCLQK